MTFDLKTLGAVGVALAVMASPGSASAKSPEAAGRAIARRDCGGCHAVGRRDKSRMPEAPAFRTLGERYNVEDLAEALAEGISVGHPEMPVAIYPPEQVAQLIAYLKALQPRR